METIVLKVIGSPKLLVKIYRFIFPARWSWPIKSYAMHLIETTKCLAGVWFYFCLARFVQNCVYCNIQKLINYKHRILVLLHTRKIIKTNKAHVYLRLQYKIDSAKSKILFAQSEMFKLLTGTWLFTSNWGNFLCKNCMELISFLVFDLLYRPFIWSTTCSSYSLVSATTEPEPNPIYIHLHCYSSCNLQMTLRIDD